MPTCENCGITFEAKAGARFHSDACRKAFARNPDTVRDNEDVRDPVVRDTEDSSKPWIAMYAEADRLSKLQVKERGLVPGPEVDGKRTQIPGPYVATPEREARAASILNLRKSAARLQHP